MIRTVRPTWEFAGAEGSMAELRRNGVSLAVNIYLSTLFAMKSRSLKLLTPPSRFGTDMSDNRILKRYRSKESNWLID